jgi:hypothetical protein
MNAPAIVIPDIPGTPTEIGIFFARIRIDDALHALFQPPKAISERPADRWNRNSDLVADALSFCDGYANTVAMAKAGSKVAQWALDNGMHIPSLDEQDLQYRFFKPTTAENSCYMRSGINLNAETPLHPYTPDFPKQTTFEDFRAGGPEAFDPEWYWSSTQCRAWDGCAWAQYFEYGYQFNLLKGYVYPVRLVRREIIR